MATSTSHWSPGVWTPLPTLTWNPDTPLSEPWGGAHFGRIVRKGRHQVAEAGRYVGEDVAGKLHSVAGIAGESHDYFVEGLYASLI